MKSPSFAAPISIEGNALFLSDAHLGVPSEKESMRREELMIQLLEEKKGSFQHLFLLGDIFDYWFEYHDVVPKGFFRLFNTLYELNRVGVNIYFFTGNHDMWVQDYFTQQFGCRVFYQQQAFRINNLRCLIGHGDGIGGKQYRYLFVKHLFAFKPNRILYGMLHPKHSFAIARFFSKKSRASHSESMLVFQSEQEHQVQFARQILEHETVDCFIYGHRHVPVEYRLSDSALFFNVGDWLTHFSYLTLDAEENKPQLHYFNNSRL